MLRALIAVVAAGCGRLGFDGAADSVDARGGTPEPDLSVLLPDEMPNLVGYWRMDGDWNDSGPLGNDLVEMNGAPAFTSPVVGTSAGAFDDTSFVVTNRPSIEVAYLTMSAWFLTDLVNTPNSNSGHTLLRISCATCGGDPEIDIAFAIKLDNDGSVESTIGDSAAGLVAPDRWHHVAAVYAPNESRLYLDGEIVMQGGANSALPTSGGILWVGQYWPNRAPLFNPQYLHGAMDELAIWSSVLSDADIRAIYANQKP